MQYILAHYFCDSYFLLRVAIMSLDFFEVQAYFMFGIQKFSIRNPKVADSALRNRNSIKS